MPKTYTKTKTQTFTLTKTDVVLMQYQIALEYANVLTEKEKKNLLRAIHEQKIKCVGIYAYDSKNNRVAEVEIKIDWNQHNQLLMHGETFDYTGGGFNHKTGEAAETKVYVDALVQLAHANKFKMSCWIILSEKLSSKEKEETLRETGFLGGKPRPWRGDLVVDHKERYVAIPQMEIALRAIDI